jgi:UDPglucose 6-dehydrogenase
MKIAVVGLWHLGTITSLCLSKIGHRVEAFDDRKIIQNFNKKILPISEPGVKQLFNQYNKKNLIFNSNLNNLVNHNIIWICYDSKITEKDVTEEKKLFNQIKKILKFIKKKTTILISSQLPLGTISKLEKYDKLILKKKLAFIYIPENLRLGKSIKLFLKPERIVIGLRDKKIYKNKIKTLFNQIKCKKYIVNPETAEISKHVINSFLACSISFINEISQIAKIYGVNFNDLQNCIKSDRRLGKYSYLNPGLPFSGGTLARDLNFLNDLSNKFKTNNILIKSIYKSNSVHSMWVKNILKKNIKNKNTSILQIGLGYTANSSTLRRSFPFQIFKFLNKKCKVKIFDEYIRINSKEVDRYKKNFIRFSKSSNLKKFNIILIFNSLKNKTLIKNLKLNKSLIIDVNSGNKKFFMNKKLNYISYEV